MLRWSGYSVAGTMIVAVVGVLLLLSLTNFGEIPAWKFLRFALIGGIFFWLEDKQQTASAPVIVPDQDPTLTA